MANFRRLPPVLRVASLLRPLFPLGLFAAVALMVAAGAWSSGQEMVWSSRMEVIAVNLGVLGLGSSLVVHAYNSRLRHLGAEAVPLASWQGQVKTLLALATIPVCAIVMAVVISPTVDAFQFVFPASLVGVFVCVAVAVVLGFGRKVGA